MDENFQNIRPGGFTQWHKGLLGKCEVVRWIDGPLPQIKNIFLKTDNFCTVSRK